MIVQNMIQIVQNTMNREHKSQRGFMGSIIL